MCCFSKKPDVWHVCCSFFVSNASLHSPRVLLPEYVLDFGFVIPGQVLTHTVNVTNTGSVAVSFYAQLKPLEGTGNIYIALTLPNVLWHSPLLLVMEYLSTISDSKTNQKHKHRSKYLLLLRCSHVQSWAIIHLENRKWNLKYLSRYSQKLACKTEVVVHM